MVSLKRRTLRFQTSYTFFCLFIFFPQRVCDFFFETHVHVIMQMSWKPKNSWSTSSDRAVYSQFWSESEFEIRFLVNYLSQDRWAAFLWGPRGRSAYCGEGNEKIQLGLKTGQRQMVVIVWHLSLCNCSHREEANFLHKFELKSFKNTKRNRSLI